MTEFDVTIRVNLQSKCDNPTRDGYCYLSNNICPGFGGFHRVKDKMMVRCDYKKPTKKERIIDRIEKFTDMTGLDELADDILAIMDEK